MGPAPRIVPDWDTYYLAVCRAVAARSKDPTTQIGCIIIGPAHEIRTTGYNSFPRNIKDDVPERLLRPEKYFWFEHAERNAIYNAARAGTPLEGCTAYVEVMPCMDCARAIVQAGISKVVVDSDRMQEYSSEFYGPQFERVPLLFAEANVQVKLVSMRSPHQNPVAEPPLGGNVT